MPLMDVGFAIISSLARHRRPQIQFLSIGSRVCSALLSDLASRLGPCASLSLHVHHAVKRTFTSKLSNMLGTLKKGPALWPGPLQIFGSYYARIRLRRSPNPSKPRTPTPRRATELGSGTEVVVVVPTAAVRTLRMSALK